MGTNFQFNIVRKWKKYHRLYSSFQGHISPTNRLFCRGVQLSLILWVVNFTWRLTFYSEFPGGREGQLPAGSEAPDSTKAPPSVYLLGLCAVWCKRLTCPAIGAHLPPCCDYSSDIPCVLPPYPSTFAAEPRHWHQLCLIITHSLIHSWVVHVLSMCQALYQAPGMLDN